MGFADNLSSSPISSLPDENIDKKCNYKIQALNYTIHSKLRKTTRQKARNGATLNDVINDSTSSNINFILRLSLIEIQLGFSFSTDKHFKQNFVIPFHSNHISENFSHSLITNKFHITTRNGPERDTTKINIKRRYRAPNKTEMYPQQPTGENIPEKN